MGISVSENYFSMRPLPVRKKYDEIKKNIK